MMLRLLVLLALPLLIPSTAKAADYCHEKDLVLDQELLWDFSGFASEIPLPTHRDEVLVPSMGKALFGTSGDPQLWTIFENVGDGNLGIEYMVYKIEIRIGDAREPDSQLFIQDFSKDCSEPGLGVDYGRRRALPPLKVLPHANGSARGIEKVRVRVWGWQ
jgi:hypothetical protein